METEELAHLVEELDTRLERLRILYDQYIGGIEKIPPSIVQKDVDRRIWVLRREKIRNTGVRFRFQQIVQRYNTLTTYWQRVCREIENGTYKRHVARARRRFGDVDGTKQAPVATAATELDMSIDVELEDASAWAQESWDEEPEPTLAAAATAPASANANANANANAPPRAPPPGEHPPDLLAFATVTGRSHTAARDGVRPEPPPLSRTRPPIPAVAEPSRPRPPAEPAPNAPMNSLLGPPLSSATSPTAKLAPELAPSVPAMTPPSPSRAAAVLRARLHPMVSAMEHRASVPGEVSAPAAPRVIAKIAVTPGVSGMVPGPAPTATPAAPSPVAPAAPAASPVGTTSTANPEDVRRRASVPSTVPPPPAAIPRPAARMTLPSAPLGPLRTPDRPTTAPTARLQAPAPQPAPQPTPQAAPQAAPKPAPVVATEAMAAVGARVVPAASRPVASQPTRPEVPRTEQAYRAVYAQYVESRRKNGESTAGISYESLSRSLADTAAKLKDKSGGRSVDFDVVVKDGKTMLRPVVR